MGADPSLNFCKAARKADTSVNRNQKSCRAFDWIRTLSQDNLELAFRDTITEDNDTLRLALVLEFEHPQEVKAHVFQAFNVFLTRRLDASSGTIGSSVAIHRTDKSRDRRVARVGRWVSDIGTKDHTWDIIKALKSTAVQDLVDTGQLGIDLQCYVRVISVVAFGLDLFDQHALSCDAMFDITELLDLSIVWATLLSEVADNELWHSVVLLMMIFADRFEDASDVVVIFILGCGRQD